MDRQAAQSAAFLKRLNAIPAASLPPAEQANRAILKRTLGRRDRSQPLRPAAAALFDARQLSRLPRRHGRELSRSARSPTMTIIWRGMALVPERMQAYGEISAKAAREGYAQPCVTHDQLSPATITRIIAADPTQSRFYAPFAGPEAGEYFRRRNGPRFKRGGGRSITIEVNPSYEAFADGSTTASCKTKCRKTRRRLGHAAGPGILRLPGPQQTTTGPDARRNPPDRPEGSCADPRRDGGGREQGRLRQPRGDDRRHAHQSRNSSPRRPKSCWRQRR